MLYGILEMRLESNRLGLNEREQEFAKNEEGTYEIARKLTIEIEMNLFMIKNK